MICNALIHFRNGGFYLTQIDDEQDTPVSLAQRMTLGGFVVCADERWNVRRALVINLADVQSISLSDTSPRETT